MTNGRDAIIDGIRGGVCDLTMMCAVMGMLGYIWVFGDLREMDRIYMFVQVGMYHR